jgi:phasin family protein
LLAKPEQVGRIAVMLHCNINRNFDVWSPVLICFTHLKETKMNNPAQQIATAAQSNLAALQAASAQAVVSMEKLVDLNMTAAKSVMGESFEHAKAVMAVKTPQEFMTLQAAFFKPMVEKSVAYAQHVQTITTEGSESLGQQVEAQMATAQKTMTEAVEQMLKSAPAGSEAAVAALKSAMSQGQKAVEVAQDTLKKASATAKANVAAASKQATDMAKKVSVAV